MTSIITDGSANQQWRDLINDAMENCECSLDEELESYLVFALVRFTQSQELANSVMALEYLESVAEPGANKYSQLRDVGDKCLLFSGLFPQAFRNKLFNIGYYINMGRTSYSQLGMSVQKGFAGLYHKLSEYFVTLTDVLHSMRELNGSPVMNEAEKYRLWIDFNSDYARKSLREFYGVLPLRPSTYR